MQAKQTRQMEMSESALLRARTVWEDRRVHNLTITGLWVLRYGLVFFLLTFGSFKFFAFEAEGIRPLVANSPVLAWLYTILGVRGTSSLFGVLEVTTGLLIALRRWFPTGPDDRCVPVMIKRAATLSPSATRSSTAMWTCATPAVTASSSPTTTPASQSPTARSVRSGTF